MAKRSKTHRATSQKVAPPARRTSAARPLVRRKSRWRRPPVSAASAAEFETLMQGIDDAIAVCVRLRRWNDLEAALTAYAQALQVDAVVLLHTTLFRHLLRQQDVAVPGQ